MREKAYVTVQYDPAYSCNPDTVVHRYYDTEGDGVIYGTDYNSKVPGFHSTQDYVYLPKKGGMGWTRIEFLRAIFLSLDENYRSSRDRVLNLEHEVEILQERYDDVVSDRDYYERKCDDVQWTLEMAQRDASYYEEKAGEWESEAEELRQQVKDLEREVEEMQEAAQDAAWERDLCEP